MKNEAGAAVYNEYLIFGYVTLPLCVAYVAYYMREWKKWGPADWIQSRGRRELQYAVNWLAFATSLICPFYSCIVGLYFHWERLRRDKDGDREHDLQQKTRVAEAIWAVLMPIAFYPVLYLSLWRLCTVWYTFKAADAAQNGMWIQYVTVEPVHIKNTGNWIADHKDTYGNPKWRAKWISVAFLCQFIFTCLLYIVSIVINFTTLANVIDMLIIVIVLCLFTYLLREIPAHNDMYELRAEMKLLVKWIALIFFSQLIGTFLVYTLYPAAGDWWNVWMTYALCGGLFYIIVGYPLRRGHALGHLVPEALKHMESSQTQMSATSSGGGKRKSTKKIMRHLFEAPDPEYLYAFAQHLVREASIECLVAFIELLQFKRLMWKDEEFMDACQSGLDDVVRDDDLDTPKVGNAAVNLPWAKIDASDLVHAPIDDVELMDLIEESHDDSQPEHYGEYKIRAQLLYEKYIADGDAPLEVNISHTTRRRLTDQMGDREAFMHDTNMNAEKLYTMFDFTTRVMYRLMSDSFTRFANDKGKNVIEMISAAMDEEKLEAGGGSSEED